MYCYLFVFVLLIVKLTSSADIQNCPLSDIKFEKILGLRPKTGVGTPTVLHQSTRNWIPITQDCITKCNDDENCSSFVLYYNASICYSYESDVDEKNKVLDTNVAWFVKVCLKGACDKLWAFDRIPGAILIGNDTKTLPTPLTRIECQQYCLNETDFDCRSVKYKINRPDYGTTKGMCILSNTDRHLTPYAYRVSTFDEEYFENQCHNIQTEMKTVVDMRSFCAYEEYVNVTLIHHDELYENGSKSDCQELCDKSTMYNCRGFTILQMPNRSSPVCLLNSEDSKIYGPKLLRSNSQATYYERATCLNISVSCSETYMTITYNPDINFLGRLYMQGYSDVRQCYANGNGEDEPVILKLSLLSFQCGISKANDSLNRSLLSGALILQYNSLIQTQNDRLIRVGCIFSNDSRILIGTGVKVTDSPIGSGSITGPVFNQTGIPTVEMRVVDYNTQSEISDTEIGQELQLIIDVKPANGPYDIWASHLVAMTERNDESIFLLDDHGCPTNLNVFPALRKIVTNTTRRLVANFQAFKFAASPVVRFSVLVQFCQRECPPINCGNNIYSFGRRKRDVQAHLLNTINGTTVVKVNRTEFNSNRAVVQELPLEFIMLVRESQYMSDKLIYGENTKNMILVAGYDYVNNEVCMDYSLVIGLIVTWVIVQIIFVVSCIVLVRRYKRHYKYQNSRQSMEELHKNFGIGFSNLENRRVHWADDGEHII